MVGALKVLTSPGVWTVVGGAPDSLTEAESDARYLTQAAADPRYVNTAGDTMTGNVQIGGQATTDAAGQTLTADGALFSTIAPPQVTNYPNLTLSRTGTATNGPALNTGVYVRFGRPWATTIGSITILNSSTVAYNTTSDERQKVRDGDLTDAADRVQRLGAQAFRGRWLGDDGEPEGEEVDLLYAHDIEAEAPYAVTGERGAVDEAGNPQFQQVNYGGMVPLLIAALSQALDRISVLENART